MYGQRGRVDGSRAGASCPDVETTAIDCVATTMTASSPAAPPRWAAPAVLLLLLGWGPTPGTPHPLTAQATTPPVAVRAWEGTLELPTYEEGPPDPNPPFDFFRPARVNYPYTIRNNLTDVRAPRAWRALFLENEYLRCSVLPDLGGHLYSCTDKLSGEEIFYDNGSIKLTQIGYRGAWAALGVEFNFPVSHNWMSTSPVDFAIREHADGSASIWVGNVDRVYRTDWRVRLTLRPGTAVLEQHTTLYNQSDSRHRYYWWTNAAVRVTDRSWILYPQRFSASHGFTNVEPWPVDARGTDLSLVGNHVFGPVSRFSHGSREAFMAVYHPDSETGVAHYSPPSHLPAKKIWSWGRDARGLDWREALSDDASAYVEIQAGIFRDQETYGFLEPQESVRFSEYWTPLRELGGLSRMNPEASVHLCRTDACGTLPAPGIDARGAGPLRVRLGVTAAHASATLRIRRADDTLHEERVDLAPEAVLDRTFPELDGTAPFTVILESGFGRELIRHTEGVFDMVPREEVVTGDRSAWTPPAPDVRLESDALWLGEDHERNGRRPQAWEAYEQGLQRHPESLILKKAMGRLAQSLGRSEEAVSLLEPVVERTSNDGEALYYLGVALLETGRETDGRLRLEGALHDGRVRGAARLKLAELAGRAGDRRTALVHVLEAVGAGDSGTRAGFMEVALLRATDQEGEASARVDAWLGRDPSHNGLRWEAYRLGARDPALPRHLAAEPERVLDLATQYIRLGLFAEAEHVLSFPYPPAPTSEREPGVVAVSDHPIVAYVLGFVRQAMGRSGAEDFRRAQQRSAAYVFPSRPETEAALLRALEHDPEDGTALSLLGSLALARLDAPQALAWWRRALEARPGLPALHRNVGLTMLRSGGPAEEAVSVLRNGQSHDPTNVGLYEALDEALEATGASAGERADALLTFPDRAGMPASLVYTTARRLVAAGRFDEADALFYDRFFPREEGGINVRQVYLEAKLARALADAEADRCGRANETLERIFEPVPELAFTASGLELWYERAGLNTTADRIRATCGVPEATP